MICGIDISSRTLDARIGPDGVPAQFPNNREGISSLALFCRAQAVELVVMEATGGYEQQALAGLSEAGLPVAIVNPRAVRQFAHSMGRLEKTDQIDAAMIAWYAAVRGVRPAYLASSEQQHLRALVTRLRQLVDLRTAQRNQVRLVTDPLIRRAFEPLLELVEKQIADLDAEITVAIANDPLWSRMDPVLRTIKGVADRTVARLFAELPELGTLSNKTISKLAGLAPLARDSGAHKGYRSVRGGRAAVREILFVVASVVGRYEPDFIAFQKRLREAGKPPKVVRVALAHKLLVRLNAKARELRQSLTTATKQCKEIAA